MRAMLLAAGRGERMRPLTDTRPKPLLEVHGRSLIERQIDRLREAGLDEIVINLGWRGHQIEARLGDGRALGVTIEYSREPETALETAGGIVQALPLLGSEPFLVVNSDIETDLDLKPLTAMRLEADAHLVLVDNPEHHRSGDFALIDGRLRLTGSPKYTYSGIGVFRPALFAPLPPGRLPLRPVLEQAIADDRVTGQRHSGRWLDIGTPERLAELNRVLGHETDSGDV
ncbi:MAG: N-acetylmuramate alpha-1-phosphate uridylyltransferase MurU [Wenzhouxiangellaceae bacterium]